MDPRQVGTIWEENAEGWTAMSRAGFDRARDLFNTPTFFEILPPIKDQKGLDIGCGEGHNTRLLAGHGAEMTGIDISQTFIRYAEEADDAEPLGGRSAATASERG